MQMHNIVNTIDNTTTLQCSTKNVICATDMVYVSNINPCIDIICELSAQLSAAHS